MFQLILILHSFTVKESKEKVVKFIEKKFFFKRKSTCFLLLQGKVKDVPFQMV